MPEQQRRENYTSGELSVGRSSGQGWVWRLGGLGVWELCKRLVQDIREDHVFGRAAQLAFYFMLAFFPLVIFAASLAGVLLADEKEFTGRLLSYVEPTMPEPGMRLLETVFDEILEEATAYGLLLSLVFAIWTASYGAEAIIDGMNFSFDVRDTRSWWKRRLLGIGMTVLLGIALPLALVTTVWGSSAVRSAAGAAGIEGMLDSVWAVLRWGFLLLFLLVTVGSIYRFAPNLKSQTWTAIAPGALFSIVLWVLLTVGLRIYIDRYFESYTLLYGSLGAAIALMLWLWLSGAALLIGAEVNSEIRWAAAEAGSADARRSFEDGEMSAKEEKQGGQVQRKSGQKK
jgi:membrane protein